MKKIHLIILQFIFPLTLIFIISYYFIHESSFKYFNPEERIIKYDSKDVLNIDKNIDAIMYRLESIKPENKYLQNKLKFVLGFLLYSKKDYKSAEVIFRGGIKENNLLFDYSSYYLAKILVLDNKYNEAIVNLNNIDFEKSTLKEEITELLGLCNYELGFFDKASYFYELLIKKFTQTKSKKLQVMLTLANIYRNLNDYDQEMNILKKIIIDNPTNSITGHLKKRFKNNDYLNIRDKNNLTDFKKALLSEGDGYFESKDFLTSSKIYKKYLTFFPNDLNKLLVLNKLKYCYKLINEEDSYTLILEQIANLAPDESSLYALAINYMTYEKYEKAAEIFQNLIINFPSSFKIFKYFYNLARVNEEILNYSKADYYYRKVLSEITSNSTEDENKYAQKSVFKIGWLLYKEQKYYQAVEYFKSTIEKDISNNFENRIHYWIARSYEKLGLYQLSDKYYKKIIVNDRFSYYGLKALENLNGSISRVELEKDSALLRYKTRTIFLTSGQRKKLDKIEFFIYYDLIDFAKKEISSLKINTKDHNFLFYIATLKHQVGDILGSIKILNKITDITFNNLPTYGLKMLWPKKYWSIIENNSNKLSIDPFIPLAIIRQESAFNENAVSIANARGLMQILPTVASTVAKRINMSDFDLFKPEDNISISSKYISEVLSKYTNKAFAIAAYNAGDKPVKRWMQRFSDKSIEEFIEEIPYDETFYYVRNVLRNFINYNRLYGYKDNLVTDTK